MKKTLFEMLLFSMVTPAMAAMPICLTSETPLPQNLTMSEQSIHEYQLKLKKECELSLRAYKVGYKLEEQGTKLEHINMYQALRYVDINYYNNAKYSNIPVPYIYQSDDNNKQTNRQRVIWDNWSAGIEQLAPARDAIYMGKQFAKEDLVRIHKGFYKYSDEQGSYAHDPAVGVFKSPNANDSYWMTLNTPEELQEAIRNFDVINSFYKSIGLIDSKKDPAIYNVLRIKTALDKNGQSVQAVYGGDTRANMEHLDRVLNFMNSALQQGLERKHIVYSGRLFTPGEVAFLTQQFYVQVHPFSEGNGRTSRFIQELILTSLGLPHGASGTLMNIDVYSPPENYYVTAMQKTEELIGRMESCLDTYKVSRMKSEDKIRAGQNNLDYDCRLVD